MNERLHELQPLIKGRFGKLYVAVLFNKRSDILRASVGERVKSPKIVKFLADFKKCPMEFKTHGYRGDVFITVDDVLDQTPTWVRTKANCFYVELGKGKKSNGDLAEPWDIPDLYEAKVTFFHAKQFEATQQNVAEEKSQQKSHEILRG